MIEDTASKNAPSKTPQIDQIYIADERGLYSRAGRAERPTDIVMTPEQLHRRNLKRAFARRSQPRSSLALRTPADVAQKVIATQSGSPPDMLDRLNRIQRLETILADNPDSYDELKPVFGTDLTASIEQIEVARQELRLMAGSDTDRLTAVRNVADGLSAVGAADTSALLSGLQRLDMQLRENTTGVVSESALFERATRVVEATDGAAWVEAYEHIERIAVAGISTLGTPLLEFLHSLSVTADLEVALYLRAGTGPRIRYRLDSRIGESTNRDPSSLSNSQWDIQTPTCPVTEIPATTRHEECRAAAALVDGLLKNGHEVSDIALVARDADEYKRPLSRAMAVYGRHLSVWSQLELKRTLPYQLVVASCEILDTLHNGMVDIEQLLRPLALHWTPQRGSINTPMSAAELSALRRQLDDGEARSVESWLEHIGDVGGDVDTQIQQLVAFLNWCRNQPTRPEPEAITEVLTPLVDAFDQNVLPSLVENDDPDYTDVSRTARAVERVAGETEGDHLIRETRAKYGNWVNQGYISRSWGSVRDVLDALATARPGRREHKNAERVDVLDATDTWLRSYPYVIALGLVDGVWPQRTHGAFPAEFRAAAVDGDSPPARQLGVRGAWTEAREYDHFADVVRTASDQLVVTRFREDVEGVSYQRSPLLETLNPTQVEDNTRRQLCSESDEIPAPLSSTPAETASNDGDLQ
ncbi:hypothetical protein [Haloarcula laminariae]|uniref:hypothetical protein n=1 Tax=Haloarcula laminariae TaxID=2961577 RepID=UPI0021C93004|nr:hypothetical protein [Halomicroarcula laminariae]